MIWRLVICFSFLSSLALAATVTGSVAVVDEPRSEHGQDLSGTVLWLESTDRPMPQLRPVTYQMQQKNKTFTPHTLVITTGSYVNFPNLDPIFHNAFSNFNGQVFDVGLYPPGSSRKVKFTRPGVVRIFCNIHSSMSAVIVVVPSPYFAVTDKQGELFIPNVPPGDYRLRVYHERALVSTLDGLTRPVTIARDQEAIELPVITISEQGYVAKPHLNKYGRPYNPADEAGSYPGARK